MPEQTITRTQEIVETLTEFGYRVAWVNPDSTIAHGFKDGQTYPYSSYKQEYDKAESLALILDDKILVDFDLNKWVEDSEDGKPLGPRPCLDKLAAVMGLDEMPQPVQSNDEGTSLHFLFSKPEHCPQLKSSNDGGCIPYVDFKSGNQVMHVKLHKQMDLNDLEPDGLPVATQQMIDVLGAQQMDSSPAPMWNGDDATLEENRRILESVPVPPDYSNWMTVLFGIHSRYGYTEEAVQLADEWSQKGEGYLGTNHVRYKLSTMGAYNGREVTFGTICKLAERNGFDLNASATERGTSNVSPIRDGIEVEAEQPAMVLEPVWDDPINWWEDVTYPHFPMAAVPSIVQRRARAIHEVTGQDPAGHAITHLSAIGTALDCKIQICLNRRKQWYTRPVTWILKVGGSGAGKSVTDKLANKPLNKMQFELMEQYASELEDYEEALAQHSEAKKQKKAFGMTKPEKPKRPDFMTNDSTIEAMREMLVDNDRGVTVHIDEFDTWNDSHGAYKAGGKAADKAHYLKAFDGGPHKVDRVDRTITVKNWSAGIIANVTPAGMRKTADQLLVADGTLQRFLIVMIRPGQPASFDAEGLTKELDDEWGDLLRSLYYLEPFTVYMTKDAEKLHHDFVNQCMELAQGLDDINPGLASMVSKMGDQVGRITLYNHCVRHKSQSAAHQVCTEDLQMAIDLVRGLYHHAASLYEQFTDTGQLGLVKDLATGILASKLSGHVTWSELRDCCKPFGRIIKRAADKKPAWDAVRMLMDTGWLQCTTNQGMFYPGKQNAFVVNPLVHDRFAEHGEKQRKVRQMVRTSIEQTAAKAGFADAPEVPDEPELDDAEAFLANVTPAQPTPDNDDPLPF